MTKQEILLVLSATDSQPRGSVLRITAKKTDFYLDFAGERSGGIHLSAHGPNRQFDSHRFHVRMVPSDVRRGRKSGDFVEHGLARSGHHFEGRQLSDDAFLVARVRWAWDLQREKYRNAALIRSKIPKLSDADGGRVLSSALAPNSAWDLDIVVSYKTPHWPHPTDSDPLSSRLGPLQNDSGMWLTATSYHRSMMLSPTPEPLTHPLPRPDQTPQFMLSGGPGNADDIYWFVQGITFLEMLEATAAHRGHPLPPRSATD